MIRFTMLIAACLLAHGCSVLAPMPDSSRFFTLPVPPEAQAHRAEGSDATPEIVYGLGPITLPAYLDRREVATRISPTELTYSRTDCWAQPLAANVSSVLLQTLSSLLGTDRVVLYPWGGTGNVDYQVEVSLLRFERDAAGESHLTGHWSIKDPRDGRVLVAKETSLARPGPPGDTSATTTALSGTLSDLGAEITTALRELPPRPLARTPVSPKHQKGAAK